MLSMQFVMGDVITVATDALDPCFTRTSIDTVLTIYVEIRKMRKCITMHATSCGPF